MTPCMTVAFTFGNIINLAKPAVTESTVSNEALLQKLICLLRDYFHPSRTLYRPVYKVEFAMITTLMGDFSDDDCVSFCLYRGNL